MHGFPLVLLLLQGGAFVAALIIIIFLVIRKIRIRKQEDFEKRSN